MKIISFAVIIVSLPQICLLSFQMHAAADEYIPQICAANSSNYHECDISIDNEYLVAQNYSWSDQVIKFGKSLSNWNAALQTVQSLSCLVAFISIMALVSYEHSVALQKSKSSVDVDEMLANAAKEKGQNY